MGRLCYNQAMPAREKQPKSAFGELLRRLRHRERMSQEEFAARLGVSASQYGRYERGAQLPPVQTLEAMADALGVDSSEWLEVAGYEPEEATEELPVPLPREAESGYVPRPSDSKLPVLGTLHGGLVCMPEEEPPSEYFPCLEEHAKVADGVVRIVGDSLHPLILEGDYVAIKKTPTAQPGQIVVARVGDDGDVVMKRYVGRRKGKVILESVNPMYPPIQADKIEILAVVVWQHRTGDTLRKFGR